MMAQVSCKPIQGRDLPVSLFIPLSFYYYVFASHFIDFEESLSRSSFVYMYQSALEICM